MTNTSGIIQIVKPCYTYLKLFSYHRVPNCFTEYMQNIYSTDHSVLRRQEPSGQYLTCEGLVMARTWLLWITHAIFVTGSRQDFRAFMASLGRFPHGEASLTRWRVELTSLINIAKFLQKPMFTCTIAHFEASAAFRTLYRQGCALTDSCKSSGINCSRMICKWALGLL